MVVPDNVLDHGALEPGHVDGEECSRDEDKGVHGQDTRLYTPQAWYHHLKHLSKSCLSLI